MCRRYMCTGAFPKLLLLTALIALADLRAPHVLTHTNENAKILDNA